MSEQRICVFTVLTGGYEQLNEQPMARLSSLPFICLTDDPRLSSESWDCRVIQPAFPLDLVRSQRDMKIRPHVYLPEFTGSIYIDNSVVLDSPPEKLWVMHDPRAGFTLPPHSGRTCLLDEFVAVMQHGLDDGGCVAEQLDHLLLTDPEALEERPWWTGILLRDHHRPDAVRLTELWYANVLRYSRRDQLSLNVAFRRLAVVPGKLSIDNHRSNFHHWPIRRERRARSTSYSLPQQNLPAVARLRSLEQREAEVAKARKSLICMLSRAQRWASRNTRDGIDRVLRLIPVRLRRSMREIPFVGS